MKTRHILLFVILLAWIAAIGYAQEGRTVIQSGHFEEINCLRFHEKADLLFSASDDGCIKVWDTNTSEVLQSLRISFRPVEEIAVHPVKPHIAALEITGPASSVMTVADWEKGEILFREELAFIPLFFTYSPKGNYLVYGKPEWNSLSFFDAETGGRRSFFQDGFGIVSCLIISDNEKNIMAYQSSGKISYWKLSTQKPLLDEPISTLPDLAAISISGNKRFIAASTGKKLVIVDLVTGRVIAHTDMEGITSTGISRDDTEVICIAKKEGTSGLYRFRFNGSDLVPKPIVSGAGIFRNVNTPVYTKKGIFFSGPAGRIYELSSDDTPKVFSSGRLIRISDIAFISDLIALSNDKQIITFPLNLLDVSETTIDDVSGLALNVFGNTLNTDVGLEFLRTNKLLFWSKDTIPAGFNVLNIKTGEIEEECSDFANPLIQLDFIDDTILTLEKNGRTKLLDKVSFKPSFDYTVKGMNKVIYVSDSILIGARSKLSSAGSSIISINPKTGETVPLSDPSLLCYDIAYDPASRYLYSLSIGHDESGSVTMFKAHYGRGYERERIISSFAGEDLSASIALVPGNRQVYTSLGFDSIKRWNERTLQSFPPSTNIPRKLYVAGTFLLSLNRDRSITIWDRFKHIKMFDLYFFDDFKWIAIFPEGDFVTSKSADDYVKRFSTRP